MNFYYLTEKGRVGLSFSKADYQALAETVRRSVKAYFRFSRTEGVWVSKGAGSSLASPKLANAVAIAKQAGLSPEEGAETAAGPSYGERREAFGERAAARAERRDERGTKKLAEAHAVTNSGTSMMDAIPFGQPMMPDHYSYSRDRRYRERAWAKIQKGADLAKEARASFERAASSARIAGFIGNESAAFAQRRIEDAERELRDLARKMERCDEGGAEAQAKLDKHEADGEPEPVIEGDRENLRRWHEWGDRLDAARAEALDKLGHWLSHIESIGGVAYSREAFKERPPVGVKYRGTWYTFKRANAKTVTVGGWMGFPDWTWKVTYAEIQEVHYGEPDALAA